MTDMTADSPPKGSKLPLILGLILALLGAGGGYYAVIAGLLPVGHGDAGASHTEAEKSLLPSRHDVSPLGDIAFVDLPPLVVSLNPSSSASHLRFTATLEVPRDAEAEVREVQPRILDAMNGYLRALDPKDFESRGALMLVRSQLVRRIELVIGPERLRDLLVLEFVLD
ncbi:flagellar basal body-associated FliL family protein [Litorisediminicola beolgyonensis]|uniref:Flagellar protein FliL n=1 Tax=Litorisediminicola beolgyonensis TaxID=1173614 RepID=A0ABW3ZML3_9RHOB